MRRRPRRGARRDRRGADRRHGAAGGRSRRRCGRGAQGRRRPGAHAALGGHAARADSGAVEVPGDRLQLQLAPRRDPGRPRQQPAVRRARWSASTICAQAFPDQKLPTFFNKQVSCITGPYDPILAPYDSPMLDYEGELVAVIGRRVRRADAATALGVGRRLHRGQRRVGTRLAAGHADHVARQELRHPRADRAVDRHRRRGGSGGPRRSAPGSTANCARTARRRRWSPGSPT